MYNGMRLYPIHLYSLLQMLHDLYVRAHDLSVSGVSVLHAYMHVCYIL